MVVSSNPVTVTRPETFVNNFDYVSQPVLVFLLLTLGMYLFVGLD